MSISIRTVARVAVVAVLTLGAVVLVRQPGSAATPVHLRLVKSEPSKGDTVASPKVLRLWFSEPATLSVSSIKLKGPHDQEVTLGKLRFAGDVKEPVEATVGANLPPGAYTLSYRTASRDMHPIKGDFTFVVR